MFVPIPTEVQQTQAPRRKSVANGVIVSANVLAFVFGGASSWFIGYPGHGWWSVLSYGFAHAGFWHLIGNMYLLLMIGNPVNRRIGNAWYFSVYIGSILVLGVAGWFSGLEPLRGSSGAIFVMIAIFLMLMPAAIVRFSYVALFPVTVLIGLLRPPAEWTGWFIDWGRFYARAWLFLLVIPVLELWGFVMWRLAMGEWPWTHPAHLLGFVLGVLVVAALPREISMGRQQLGT